METEPTSPYQANQQTANQGGIPASSKSSGLWLALLGFLYLASLVGAVVLVVCFGQLPVAETPRPAVSGRFGISLLDVNAEAIGVVRLDGVITMERQGFFGETVVDRVKKGLERLAKKRQVKALILRVNSPGGTVASAQELYRSIHEIRQKYKKPVIALLGDVAASGGYYVATACDKIVAEPGTITGSIGVIFQTMHVNQLAGRFGIDFNTIKSGAHKDMGNPTRPMTPQEKEILQDIVNTAYEQFIGAVAEGREMDLEVIRKLADGRIMLGYQARQTHLVDEDSGFEGAVQMAKELGKIKGEPKLLKDTDFREDFLEEIFWATSNLKPFSSLEKRLNVPSGLLYLWTGS